MQGLRYQFSATTGTVFHDSHLSLVKWFMAVGLIVEAKKESVRCKWRGTSTWKRATKRLVSLPSNPQGYERRRATNGIVEVDETYLTPKKPRKGKPYVKKESRDVVLGMIERGGKLRLVPIKDSKDGND